MSRSNDLTPIAGRPADVGLVLRAARLKKGLTQAALAEASGLTLKTVQRAEKGRPSADTLWRLGLTLDLPLKSLAPDWNLPSCAHAAVPGVKFRERRRSFEPAMSLKYVADYIRVSSAELSRFERGISVPTKWTKGFECEPGDFLEIHDVHVAWILGFRNTEELNEFLNSEDCRAWKKPGASRSLFRRQPERLMS